MGGTKHKRQVFYYKAKDGKGLLHQGKVISVSMNEARNALTGRDYTILSLTQQKSFLKNMSILGKVNAKERSVLYRELSTMLKAGLSITQSIDIATETPNKKLQQVLKDIYASLENGFALSIAMSSFPKVFPVVEVGVIRAGEATGNLSKVLMELSRSTERSADFSSRVKGAMIYPAFIITTLAIVGAIVMVKVIPPIKDIFAQTGVELPMSTKILLGITDGMVAYWYYILAVIVGVGVLAKLYLSTKSGKKTAGLLSLNFPIFGQLSQQVFLARFSRTMSLLVSAGVPIIETVSIIKDSTVNVIYKDVLDKLSDALEQGSSISTSLSQTKYFPQLMSQLLYVGQQSGDLGGVTSVLAEYYENEVDAKLKTFSSLIEPFIMLVVGSAVAFVIISVLQPIYNLTGAF